MKNDRRAYFAEMDEHRRLQSWRPDTLALWRASMEQAQRLHHMERPTPTQAALAENHVLAATSARLAHPVDGMEKIAYHEAGHVVLAAAFGFDVFGANIVPVQKANGRTRLGVTLVAGVHNDKHVLHHRIAGIAAGRAAELLAVGRQIGIGDLPTSDATAAHRHAERLAMLTGRDAFAELHSGVGLARTILMMPDTWNKVVSVAAALLEKQALCEAEIDELLCNN